MQSPLQLSTYYPVLIIIALFVLPWIYGTHVMRKESTSPVQVAIVQPYINSEKSNIDLLKEYEEMLEEAVQTQPNLVVLPENFFLTPYDLENNTFVVQPFLHPLLIKKAYQTLLDYSKKNPATIFVAGLHTLNDGKHFNSAVLIQNGVIEDMYDKQFLFPLSERVPGRNIVEHFVEQNNYRIANGGNKHTVTNQEHTFGVLICSEVMFPQLAKDAKKQGSEFLVVIGNDSIVQNAIVADIFLAMAQFRAVETGQWVYRAATNGYSAIIDPHGNIRSLQERNTQDILTL